MLFHPPAMCGSIRTSGVNGVLSLSRDCGDAAGVCVDQSSIMYAWGRNAPSTKLPRGIHSLLLSETTICCLVRFRQSVFRLSLFLTLQK